MKIVKTNDDARREDERRKLANTGCNKCPCCGETMPITEAIRLGFGHERGISHSHTTRRMHKIDIYRCYACGAEWESDPY